MVLEVDDIFVKTSISEVTLTVGKVIEEIQLVDNVAKAEKAQITEWIRERYGDVLNSIDSIEDFIQAFNDALSGNISSDTIGLIVNLIQSIQAP